MNCRPAQVVQDSTLQSSWLLPRPFPSQRPLRTAETCKGIALQPSVRYEFTSQFRAIVALHHGPVKELSVIH